MVGQILYREKKRLIDFKREGLVQLSGSFNGSFSGMDEFETDLGKIILEDFELTSTGLKLVGGIDGRKVSGYIRSENTNLLKGIEENLKPLIGHSIDEAYRTPLPLID